MGLADDLTYRYWQRSGKPIIIGPWSSELGFESLYFLPWLSAWREKYHIDPERLYVISRGGASAWYDVPPNHTLELFDYLPPKELRLRTLALSAKTGSVKQNQIQAWERQLLPLWADRFGLTSYHWLHPKAMYQGLHGWWGNTMALGQVGNRLKFLPIPTGHPPLELALPDPFVALGFYARPTWPLTEETRGYVQSLVDGIRKTHPVVIIDSPIHADDHIPFPIQGDVLHTAPFCTQTTSLQVQGAVLAKAAAFIGTYGGLMQLAVRLKKPAVGLYTQFGGTAYAHKILTEYLATSQGTAVYIGRPQDVNALPVVKQV